jgi:undecaprenyl diphosphate synthase
MPVPNCLVIIPDGNRRWARSVSKTSSEGHTRGLLNGRRIATAAFERGVTHVVFLCATEQNMDRRPQQEKQHLINLCKKQLRWHQNHPSEISLHICGSKRNLSPETEALKKKIQEVSHKLGKVYCTLLFDYDGVREVGEAASRLVGGKITPERIQCLIWTKHVPAVDLIIRTGYDNDPHYSGSLLPCKTGNAQIYFSGMPWPAFGVRHLDMALADFAKRERRMGA